MQLLQRFANFLVAIIGTLIVTAIVRFSSKDKVEQRTGGWSPMSFSEADN